MRTRRPNLHYDVSCDNHAGGTSAIKRLVVIAVVALGLFDISVLHGQEIDRTQAPAAVVTAEFGALSFGWMLGAHIELITRHSALRPSLGVSHVFQGQGDQITFADVGLRYGLQRTSSRKLNGFLGLGVGVLFADDATLSGTAMAGIQAQLETILFRIEGRFFIVPVTAGLDSGIGAVVSVPIPIGRN
ncbi:MAG: hypothetical protein ACT4O1_08415 [Gemmatimonadota bacterium]